MALNPEFDNPLSTASHTNLRRESTLKRLLKEKRYPAILAYDGEEQLEEAICFIPAGKTKPAETFTISLEEAGKIAAIRDKLQRLI